MSRNQCRTNEEPLKYKINPSYHCVLQDHNYGAPPPPTPPQSPTMVVPHQLHQNPLIPPPLSAHDLSGIRALATVADQMRSGANTLCSMMLRQDEDSQSSMISSEEDNDRGLEGEETETAAEGEGDEDSITRCICDFEHDDGYMICCDKCCVWQHVDCMGIDRSNIPEDYMCEKCQPRRVDRTRARNLQLRKQMHNDTSSSDDENAKKSQAVTQLKKLNTGAKKKSIKKEAKKVVKRQKRDSAAVVAREQRANERRNMKKKESTLPNSTVKTESKKIAGRRRSKGKTESIDEDTQDCWSSTASQISHPQQLRQWVEQYEEAVTNHYSPELRARIQAIKVNGVHSDFKVGPVVVQKCRTTLGDSGIKVLLSSAALQPNQPIMEIMGKFMLAAQHSVKKAVYASPYLLFYQIPKENTEVCVDARTYGNDARFVRRSCQPNAEVRHCIEKGALHLYLVASTAIDKNQEIMVKHEDPVKILCRLCAPQTPIPDCKKNGHSENSSSERIERTRRVSRRNTEESSSELSPAPPVLQANSPSPVSLTPTSNPTTPAPPILVPSAPPTLVAQPVQSTPKKAPKSPVKQQMPAIEKQPPCEDYNDDDPSSSPDKRKMVMTREERKMEAIMKAFERLEKQEQRKQATQQHQKRSDRDSKESDTSCSGRFRDDIESFNDVVPAKRRGRKMRGRSASSSQSQMLSVDENSSGSHFVLSPGSTSASVSPRIVSSPPPSLGFRFPKTKKVLMNEWLNKSELPLSPTKMEEESCVGGAAAAKKRWLRQAISEETESPTGSARPASPDYVTPLKKRRLARESLEQSQCEIVPAAASSPEPKPAPPSSLPLRCVEEAVLALSGHMGIQMELAESAPESATPSPAKSPPPPPPPPQVAIANPTLPMALLKDPVCPPPPLLPAVEETSSEVKAVELVPIVDVKPEVDVKPVDVQPVDTKPVDIKQIDIKPIAPIAAPKPLSPPAPASVKRKLSISEYRQRNKHKVEKSESAMSDSVSSTCEDQSDGSEPKSESSRWNSDPTSSEKQRENLTERLKREFGLFLDDMDKTEKVKVEEPPVQGPVLLPLPPLEPPQLKKCDSLNIPLPLSPPPLLDLLTMDTQEPLEEEEGGEEASKGSQYPDLESIVKGPSPLTIKSQTPAKMKASSKKKLDWPSGHKTM